jgi:hypothetical protein
MIYWTEEDFRIPIYSKNAHLNFTNDYWVQRGLHQMKCYALLIELKLFHLGAVSLWPLDVRI